MKKIGFCKNIENIVIDDYPIIIIIILRSNYKKNSLFIMIKMILYIGNPIIELFHTRGFFILKPTVWNWYVKYALKN